MTERPGANDSEEGSRAGLLDRLLRVFGDVRAGEAGAYRRSAAATNPASPTADPTKAVSSVEPR